MITVQPKQISRDLINIIIIKIYEGASLIGKVYHYDSIFRSSTELQSKMLTD